MKFEKLNENKIKITLSMHDLEEKDINFHDFLSNSWECQDLFLDMLEEAEEKIGFKTRNCKVKIEALAMTEDDFILTVTKIMPDTMKKHFYVSPKKKVKAKRKVHNIQSSYLIYRFVSFDDYCYFIDYLLNNKLNDANKVAKEVYLCTYKNEYYLVLNELNTDYKKIAKFYTSITEFGTYVSNPELFVHKLNETGRIFIKNNALKKSFSHFVKK